MMEDNVTESVVLEDTFFLYPSRSIQCVVRLSEDKLNVNSAGGQVKVVKYETVNTKDVIGCHVMRGRTNGYYNHFEIQSDDPSAYIAIYSYPLTYGGTFLNKQQKRERYVLTFQILKSSNQNENLAIAHHWRIAILWILRQKGLGINKGITRIPLVPPPTRRLLILINPFGGTGKAYQIFRERVISLLAESDIQHNLIITDRPNHARDFVRTSDLRQWSGIVVISGDGLLFEVFNGLMEREDWEKAVKIPVGIIPGGSGNGLARAISYAVGEPYDSNNVIPSTLNIVHGKISPMDLIHVQMTEKDIFAFLSVGWGIMADIDIESERLRAIGEARFTVWALIRTLGLRKYRGRLSYLPVAGIKKHCKTNDHGEYRIERSKTMDDDYQWNGRFTEEDSDNDLTNPVFGRSRSFISINSEDMTVPEAYNESQIEKHSFTQNVLLETTYNSNDNEMYNSHKNELQLQNCVTDCINETDNAQAETSHTIEDIQENSHGISNINSNCKANINSILPPLCSTLPENWITEEGEYVLVYVSLQTHLSSDVFIAPNAKLDDGIMWLLVIHADVSRVQIINFLTSLQSGTHVDIPYVEMIPVHAFRLEPFSTDGFLTVDGEVVECGPIQAEVLPSIARIMTR